MFILDIWKMMSTESANIEVYDIELLSLLSLIVTLFQSKISWVIRTSSLFRRCCRWTGHFLLGVGLSRSTLQIQGCCICFQTKSWTCSQTRYWTCFQTLVDKLFERDILPEDEPLYVDIARAYQAVECIPHAQKYVEHLLARHCFSESPDVWFLYGQLLSVSDS